MGRCFLLDVSKMFYASLHSNIKTLRTNVFIFQEGSGGMTWIMLWFNGGKIYLVHKNLKRKETYNILEKVS